MSVDISEEASQAPYYNPAQDPVKLEELTMSPGGVPSRWVRLLAAEVIALRAALTAEQAFHENVNRTHSQTLRGMQKLLTASEEVVEYEPVMVQYKFHSAWPGHQFVWSTDTYHNGQTPIDSRQLYTIKTRSTKNGEPKS